MKREYPKNPIIAVGVVVFSGDSILLIKRRKPPKLLEWSIPGGAQKLGEKLAETAVREVYEETSILIKNITLLLLVTISISPLFAQDDCLVTLKKVQKDYEEGIIEKIPETR